MKDIQIPNGYFHLWQTFIQVKQLDKEIKTALNQDVDTLNKILAAPIAMQSSYSFFLKLNSLTQVYLNRANYIFEMAQYVKPEHFGVLGYMATRSETVAEALNYILRFSRLVIDGEEITPMQIHQNGEILILSWPFICDDYNFINELTNAMMVSLAKQILVHDTFPLYKVIMAHEAIAPLYEYQKFYGCQVEFSQVEYQFQIRTQGLQLKPQQADPSLMQLLVQQAEEAIASKPVQSSLDRQLHLIIAEYLRIRHEAPKIEDIATELCLSVRTLQRQLKDRGTSFKRILEQERMSQCERLLNQGQELTDIAVQLGYSDQSALARAFKMYNGITLLQYKKQLKQRPIHRHNLS
ncbi:AraC family transcriptional regulator [Acinetobacter sp. YH12239]|uniref:AraC family transcriptional regulator n=1 Tax=Acinetobacter sp. YH12239 TaxID=2601166 RepID=UPI0015D3EA64